jgi:hypothetical protein
VKRSTDGSNDYEFMDFLTDCVLMLDQRITEQVSTRRLRVLKFRGSGFGRNEYPYVIRPGGLHLLPITSARLEHRPLGPPMSTGLDQLDRLLDGGFRQNASILLSGPSGTGPGITIQVTDQGPGFDKDSVSGTDSGFGLFNIRERLYLHGGSLTIEPRPQGKGSQVTLHVPW